MAEYMQDYGQITLSEQLLPLIQDYAAGDDVESGRMETLQSLAASYLQVKEKPTRLAFNSVSEVLSAARDLGFSDPELNKFLSALERLLQGH